MAKQLKNVFIQKGKCAICKGSINEDWAGPNPALGTLCETCSRLHPQPDVFKPENVELTVETQVKFDPLTGTYDYSFEWRGTRVMVNGQVGVVGTWQGDGAWVTFPGDTRGLGTFIRELGYWDLRRIYEQSGGQLTPPPLDLSKHSPKPATLLDNPIVEIQKKETRNGYVIRVGDWDAERIPYIQMLHGFTNFYVKYKYNLKPNWSFEGGFAGYGFQAKNFTNGVGLLIEVNTPTHELEKVMAAWVVVMETLLRYPWTEVKNPTAIEDVWEAYCTMQDILVNIMPTTELQTVLEYAQDNKMIHFGRSY